jgi:hypothetical protein
MEVFTFKNPLKWRLYVTDYFSRGPCDIEFMIQEILVSADKLPNTKDICGYKS